jgi:uncharacterized membrane protein
MSAVDFIRRYYIDPILLNQGYNLINTFTYALLVVAATWISFKLIEKLKIEINRNFVASMMILAVLGTMVRLLEEADVSTSYFLVTPMIWIESFAFIVGLLFASRFAESKFKIPYYKVLAAVGLTLMIAPLAIILSRLVSFTGMLISLGLMVPFALGFYFIRWKLENKLVSMAHILDATATFTAIQFFGFQEMHVVPRMLIGALSPVAFILVKVVVIVAVLLLIDRYSDDKKFNNFLKIVIAIVGLAPGIRDFFLLGLS